MKQAIQLKPLTLFERMALERRLSNQLCPMNMMVEGEYARSSLASDFVPTCRYKCAKDYGPARGGIASIVDSTSSLTPCTREFANGCEVYARFGHLLYVFPEAVALKSELDS